MNKKRHDDFDEGSVADPPPPPPDGGDIHDSASRRRWWHHILREYGLYSCYITFLLLESDKDALNYLFESGKEIYLLAQKTHSKSFVMLFSREPNTMDLGFDEKIWKAATLEHVREGYSLTFAKYFNIDISKFPCMVIFKDVRSPKHILIPFSKLTGAEMAGSVRQVFSIISQAISNGNNPLEALETNQIRNDLNQKGSIVLSELRSFAGKTLEKAMEAWIKSKIS